MPVVIGVVVPILLIGASGLVKTIVRKSFDIKDYYLGLDFVVATLATAATYIIDLTSKGELEKAEVAKILYATVYGVFIGGAFLALVATHQLWEDRIDKITNPAESRRHKIGLLLVSDGLGIVCLTFFLVLVKGI